MKVQLDENTFNAYLNAAINEELDELFGSRVRKQSRRMITGQGWGNQRRNSDNFWGTANTDISNTDSEEAVPQTLVGMIKRMEQGLVSIEQVAGLQGQYEGLGEKVAAYRNGGGFKMKQSLLNAINALSRLADRLNAVERASGSNAIMESAGDYLDGVVGGNAAIGNARNMAQLGGLQKTARSASAKQGAATRALNKAIGPEFMPPTKTTKEIEQLGRNLANAKAKNQAAKDALTASNIGRNTGFWGKQVANVKNGAQMVKNAGQVGKETATALQTAGKGARVARMAGAAKTVGQVAKGVGTISQIPLLLLSIADEAARQGAQARQRKIVRTYNCASVLAKRMANIAKEISDAQGWDQAGEQQGQEQLQEINVKKSRSFFESIEAGMNQLSEIMKQIYAKLNGQGDSQVQMPASLNTRQEIAQFQEWANANGFKDEQGRELVVDGIWGRNTEYVYNQIAAAQNGGQAQQTLNEVSQVMNALTDLENKVGVTGAGGRAYSDISRMSGAMNGSRSQGARAAKFIIRSYPPVLNQYLDVLADAGANVNGIQPLKVDNRPLRDYDWQEVQMIDNRIKQLLGIAQNLEDVAPRGKGDPGRVKLPPKPVRKPKSSNGSTKKTVKRQEMEPLPQVNNPVHQQAVSNAPEEKITATPTLSAKQQAMSNMLSAVRPSAAETSLKNQRQDLNAAYRDARNNPEISRSDRQDLRQLRRDLKRGNQ